jgi:hypothetical protein
MCKVLDSIPSMRRRGKERIKMKGMILRLGSAGL